MAGQGDSRAAADHRRAGVDGQPAAGVGLVAAHRHRVESQFRAVEVDAAPVAAIRFCKSLWARETSSRLIFSSLLTLSLIHI